MFAQLSVSALNHLLAQNGWAIGRLKRFSGKTARFEVAPFSFCYTVLPDGMIGNAGTATSADAVCIIAPSLLPRLAAHDELAHAEIQSMGDATLLAEIFYLSRNLHWDAAEDLSQLTGDIAAERIVQLAQSKRQNIGSATLSLAQSTAEYLTEERPLIAKPAQLATFIQQVDTLRDDLSRLELRVSRYASQQKTQYNQ